jgi:hypothetical protein
LSGLLASRLRLELQLAAEPNDNDGLPPARERRIGMRIVQEVIMDIVPAEIAGEVHQRNQRTRN